MVGSPSAPSLGSNPKDILGTAKPPLHLVPSTALVRTSMVMKLGAAKYGPYNWRENAVKGTVYVSAAERHLRSWLDGEDTDPESQQSHIAHMVACGMILLDAMDTGNLIDDRPTPGATSRLIAELTSKVL